MFVMMMPGHADDIGRLASSGNQPVWKLAR
jgi:hypothetical protein